MTVYDTLDFKSELYNTRIAKGLTHSLYCFGEGAQREIISKLKNHNKEQERATAIRECIITLMRYCDLSESKSGFDTARIIYEEILLKEIGKHGHYDISDRAAYQLRKFLNMTSDSEDVEDIIDKLDKHIDKATNTSEETQST